MGMKIQAIEICEIRHGERIKLSMPALLLMLDSLFDLEMPVVLNFSKKISEHGTHEVDCSKHYIHIGVKHIEDLDIDSQKHELIDTLLHEFFHAYQFEQYGPKEYEEKQKRGLENIKHKRIAYQYCELESEARAFADHNHWRAVKSYEKNLSEISPDNRYGYGHKRNRRKGRKSIKS